MTDLFEQNAVIRMVEFHHAKFTDEFRDWIPQNLHIWLAFEEQALAIIKRGFSHYSARTIIEVLRHHSALKETGGVWKIGNNAVPYLAWLFDLIHPAHAGLFEYREVKAVKS